jgi:hypothetical protein
MLTDFNNIHPKLTFTSEIEMNSKLNFLGLSLYKQDNSTHASTYSKPTTADCIIPYTSYHPNDQKQAAIRYFINRVREYPLDMDGKITELNIIHNIAYNNLFLSQLTDKIIQRNLTDEPQVVTTNNPTKEKKWVTFIFTHKAAYRITNIFKKISLGIAFKTKNTIYRNFSKHTQPNPNSKFNLNGIYQLTSPDCNLHYVGQTGKQVHTRYKK